MWQNCIRNHCVTSLDTTSLCVTFLPVKFWKGTAVLFQNFTGVWFSFSSSDSYVQQDSNPKDQHQDTDPQTQDQNEDSDPQDYDQDSDWQDQDSDWQNQDQDQDSKKLSLDCLETKTKTCLEI